MDSKQDQLGRTADPGEEGARNADLEDSTVSSAAGERSLRYSRVTLRSLAKSPGGSIGAVIVTLVIFMALAAPLLAPHSPTDQNIRNRLVPPSWAEGGQPEFLLGTDQMGRDILSRIIYGTRISVAVGVSAVVVAGLVGVSLGLTSGFFGGFYDTAVMRFVDSFMSIPSLLLTMTIIGVIGPSVFTLILVLGFTQWVSYARVVRGEVLSLREREYVQAARAIGQDPFWIMVRHVLPNVMASVIVMATLNVATTIISESALSYLGLGVQPPTVTWGQMLSDGRNYVSTSWWLATFPGIAITISVLGVIFLGDWLRDVLDPRLRQ